MDHKDQGASTIRIVKHPHKSKNIRIELFCYPLANTIKRILKVDTPALKKKLKVERRTELSEAKPPLRNAIVTSLQDLIDLVNQATSVKKLQEISVTEVLNKRLPKSPENEVDSQNEMDAGRGTTDKESKNTSEEKSPETLIQPDCRGVLINMGLAKRLKNGGKKEFEHYFCDVRDVIDPTSVERRWGVDLERCIKSQNISLGDTIEIIDKGLNRYKKRKGSNGGNLFRRLYVINVLKRAESGITDQTKRSKARSEMEVQGEPK